MFCLLIIKQKPLVGLTGLVQLFLFYFSHSPVGLTGLTRFLFFDLGQPYGACPSIFVVQIFGRPYGACPLFCFYFFQIFSQPYGACPGCSAYFCTTTFLVAKTLSSDLTSIKYMPFSTLFRSIFILEDNLLIFVSIVCPRQLYITISTF